MQRWVANQLPGCKKQVGDLSLVWHPFAMPTTLTLDDDLAGLLLTAAQQKGKPVAEIAMNLLRSALGKPSPTPATTEPFRIRPHNGVFAPGVPLKKLNRLADDLDTEAFLNRSK